MKLNAEIRELVTQIVARDVAAGIELADSRFGTETSLVNYTD